MSHFPCEDDFGVAILGMSGRFPGSPDLDTFWRNLLEGVESVSFFAEHEVARGGLVDPTRRDPGYVPARGVLEGVDLFDASYFGMSPREAEQTDPQHRLFLECCLLALADGGYDPARPGGPVGVFAGSGPNRYAALSGTDASGLDGQIAAEKDYLATRVSYRLGLTGPSLTVQTACSTSLVAVHLACQSLAFGECDMALAGGVAIVLPQEIGYLHTAEGILSPDGRCRAFDAAASGTVPGNGVGVVLLKRLAEALEDGDPIRAVIRGSAINNDGDSKSGYTAPSISGQAAVVREAHAVAGVDPASISYVECHGTGTRLGDPAEIAALARAFGSTAFGSTASTRDEPAARPEPSRRRSAIELDVERDEAWIARTQARLKHRLGLGTLAPDPDLRARLDELCAAWVRRFVRARLGASYSSWKEEGAPRERLGILPRYQRVYELFLRILEQDDAREEVDPDRLEEEIRRRSRGVSSLLDLLRRCGERFERTLTGQLEPVEVLYPDGSNRLLDAFHRESLAHDAYRLYCQLLIRTVAELVRRTPRSVRLLEIGAGAGLLTWPLLATLDELGLLGSRQIEYHFTDVGATFLQNARERAAKLGHTGMSFHRLDVNVDPAEQGLGDLSCDLVIGLNAAHVGRRIATTLDHLEKLLVPGGGLLLAELTRAERWHHLTYGHAPGWWDFDDVELREDSLFLEHDRWEKVFRDRGYRDVAVFPREEDERALANYALIVARPAGDVAPPEVPSAARREDRRPGPGARCAIGSLKPNVGHLDAASGIAGLIKTVLALEREELPPSLHFERPNPLIGFSGSPFFVNTRRRAWPRGPTPRRAGVSSFGIGGTNAHLVLEEAPPRPPSGDARREQILVLSARTPTALAAASAELRRHLAAQEPDLADVAYTLQVGRPAFGYRWASVCESRDEALTALGRHGSFPDGPRACEPDVVFLFPGQGSQHPDMGRALYESEPAYRQAIDHSCEILLPHLGRDLRPLLHPAPEGREAIRAELDETALAQPALFVVEHALARLFMSWGVEPAAMLGHSIGEWVAACLASVFSLPEALRLVTHRGRLMQSLDPGALLSVPLPAEELDLEAGLAVAAVNAPNRCVVSGPVPAIERLAERLRTEGRVSRRLRTSHAFHSPATDPILDAFGEILSEAKLDPPALPFLSNVTGTWITPQEATDPGYWVRQLRETVRFAAGVDTLLAAASDGPPWFLEVGPGQSLTSLVGRNPRVPAGRRLTSLPPPGDPEGSPTAPLATALSRLWLAGVPVSWEAYHSHHRRRRVVLPGYPLERRRFWSEAGQDAAHRREPTSPGARIYVTSWSRSAPLRTLSGPGGPWIAFAQPGTVGWRLAGGLGDAGNRVLRVSPGDGFERRGEDHYTLDPKESSGYRLLLERLREELPAAEGVVHFWNLASGEPAPMSESRFLRAQDLGLFSLLWLAQAWDEVMQRPLRLILCTSGCHDVTGEETLHPEKAPLLAAARLLPREYPDLSCQVVDFTPSAAESEPTWIRRWVEHLASHREPVFELASRGRHGLSPELRALPPVEAGTSRLRPEGVYLVTEGLGEIGFVLARALAGAVRARLVVTHGGELPAPRDRDLWLRAHPEHDATSCALRRLQALEEMGAEVLPLCAHPYRPEEMSRVLAEAERRFGELHGVLHAAGATADVLGEGETNHLVVEHQLQLKAQSALVLAELLASRPLDFVILTSSLASWLGGLGSLASAAADTFLDAFAQYQCRLGETPWLSIAWDRWSLDEEKTPAPALDPDEGGRQWLRVLETGLTGPVLVATGDLEARRRARCRRDADAASADVPATARYERPAHLDGTYTAPADEWERRIAEVWEEILGIDAVGRNDDFFDLGGDSLLATQVLARLRRRHDVPIPLRQFFESPTLERFAAKTRVAPRLDLTEDTLATVLEEGEI